MHTPHISPTDHLRFHNLPDADGGDMHPTEEFPAPPPDFFDG